MRRTTLPCCRRVCAQCRGCGARIGRLGWLADAALLLEGLGESLLAVRLIQTADQARPEVVAAADRIAQCLGQANFHADALRVLDAALARGEPTPMLSFMRATTLRHLGRRAEATVEYQRCLQLAPNYGAAMLMLAQHDRAADPANSRLCARRCNRLRSRIR